MHGHGITVARDTPAEAYSAAMDKMHGPMMDGIANPDPDVALVMGMVPHHQGAIDMAEIMLKLDNGHHNHELAREIIAAQQREINQTKAWLQPKEPAVAVTEDERWKRCLKA